MAYKRNDEWEDGQESYSAEQVEAVLEHCHIEVVSDTNTHFLAYCPFHGNNDTPAFAVDKENGKWTCFNPSCGRSSSSLLDLLRLLLGLNPYQAMRVVKKYEGGSGDIAERVRKALETPATFTEFPQSALDRMYEDFKGSPGEAYMKSRGFVDETLDYFRIGFSAKKHMVVVPMHDPQGMPIGLIGRSASHTDKTFKNSVNLPKSLTTWNFHRARRTGDTVIVCESSYDAMRVHQAGYPNVIALLGGHVTSHHIEQIGKTFSTVVIMTDYDPRQYRPNCRACDYKTCQGHRPGRDLGRSLIAKMPNKKMLWAAYDDTCVFPHGAKDASDLTDDEIRQALKNAVSNLRYTLWNIENQDAELVA